MGNEVRNENEVKRLEWDSVFYGISIGRMHAQKCTRNQLENELDRARKEKIAFVEFFCSAADFASIRSSEECDFHLVDVRLTFKKKLIESIGEDRALKDLTFRRGKEKDIVELNQIGDGLFTCSRYYQYPKFEKTKVDSMFRTWIEKAVRGEFDDELYCLCNAMDILAFASLRFRENSASIGLLGVNQAYWGKEFGSTLLFRIFHLLRQRQIPEVSVVTQGRNSGAVHLYQKNGFILSHITMGYYKWLK